MRFVRIGTLLLALCVGSGVHSAEPAAAARYLPGPAGAHDAAAMPFVGRVGPAIDLGAGLTYGFTVATPVLHARSLSVEWPDDPFAVSSVILGWTAGRHAFSMSLPVISPNAGEGWSLIPEVRSDQWTFTPTLGYALTDTRYGIDLSIRSGLGIGTSDPFGARFSGIAGFGDAALTTQVADGFGIGIFGSVTHRIEHDANHPHDPSRVAIGPMLHYTARTETGAIDFTLRWASEFDGGRSEAEGVYFNLVEKF